MNKTNNNEKEFKKRCLVIGIAGSSGSGKTTFANRLIEGTRQMGLTACMFSLDNYYKSLQDKSFEDRKKTNFDKPTSIEYKLAARHLNSLCHGRSIRQPIYNFKMHTREKETVLVRPADLIVVEGLYTIYFNEIKNLCDYTVFVSTGLVTSTLRRVERDIKERGRTVEDIKEQILSTVLPMYEQYVKPTMKSAHFIVNWDGTEIPDIATEAFVRMIRDHFSIRLNERNKKKHFRKLYGNSKKNMSPSESNDSAVSENSNEEQKPPQQNIPNNASGNS